MQQSDGYPTSAWTAAQTAWAEARGDGRNGMQAVLNVIANRAAYPCWWGEDVVSVCLAREQFSSWNPDSPELAAMQAITTDDPYFAEALLMAEMMVNGELPDITGGADSYYAETIQPPDWVKTARYLRTIGRQKFYSTRP